MRTVWRKSHFHSGIVESKTTSHFQTSVEMGMKSVVRTIRTSIRTTSNDLGRKTPHNAIKMVIRVDCVAFKHPRHCFVWEYELETCHLHELYPSQMKILESRTNLPERVFEALFKGVSTLFGLRIVEKCFENAFRTVGSAFQNLRLGSINLPNPAWRFSHVLYSTWLHPFVARVAPYRVVSTGFQSPTYPN